MRPLFDLVSETVFTDENPEDSSYDIHEIWGENTQNAIKELQKLGDSMSLPSLYKILNEYKYIPCIQVGSKLPSAPRFSDEILSLISCKPLLGPILLLDDQRSYITYNEGLMWYRVNPYSPTFSGKFINLSNLV